MHSMNENCINICVRLANPSITESSNFNDRYFAKNETKQNPAVTRKRAKRSVNSILEPKTEFYCSLENCKRIFLTEKGYANHVSTEHGKNADEYPATILKVTKTEVKRDTATRDSLNNTTENAEKVKTPFRNTKPNPYQHPLSKLLSQTSETPSNIHTRDSHNELISKQKNILIRNDSSVQHKITTFSCATPNKMVLLGCTDVQEISDDDEKVPSLTAHLIKEGLQLAAKLSDHFGKHDPIGERAEQFQRNLKLIMGNYQELHNSFITTGKQPLVMDFLTKTIKTPPLLKNETVVKNISSDESDCQVSYKRMHIPSVPSGSDDNTIEYIFTIP